MSAAGRRVELAMAILLGGSGLALADEVAPRFTDRAAERGLVAVAYSGGPDKAHILESTGNGVLVLDYDGDGDQDLYLVHALRLDEFGRRPAEPSRLYRNDGEVFVDVSGRAGVGAGIYGHGGSVGDVDGDGLPDIYLTAYGANLLYRNNGDGTFDEIGVASGVAGDDWSIGATFFDADGDGDQDLYVANYIEAAWEEIVAARRTRRWRERVMVMDGPRGLPEAANRFYRNQGDGTFEEATEAAGLDDGGYGYSMGVVSFDYDRDGAPDLYVANDSTPNRLYRNSGGGLFEEVGAPAAVAYNADGRPQGSMGVGTGDADGDGWLDLAVTNFAHDYYTLYRNRRGEYFQDDSFAAGLALPTFRPLGWAALFFDADNDGDQDLFFSNGHIYPQVDEDPTLHESYRQPNQLLLNDGGRFRDASSAAGPGFAVVESSRGAAIVDLGSDGALEIVVSNQDAAPTLLESHGTTGRWIGFELRPRSGATQLLGSWVEVAFGARRAVRQHGPGGSSASESDPRLHFGLGGVAEVERARIEWPDGSVRELRDLTAERYYVVAPRSAGR
ncbi:MAG: CRTAC1 family protein [Thermoanaerobaculia bacterium]|nr:CRTAC1 family protein [Thermoanaerobaculia bacterium]